MRTPEEAIAVILDHAAPLREVQAVSLAAARGRVLAEDVASDVDLPPFQKSAMDGYAVHSADFAGAAEQAEVVLERVGESCAGRPFAGPVPRGALVAIYTGAEVPADCDAVVMVEKTREDGARVHLADRPRPGQNICNRGEDLRSGEVVLRAGRRLAPTDLSVLAAVGADPVTVQRRPRVAILSTGDELVAPRERPGPGQIREGNTLHLAALAERAGAEVLEVALVRDDPAELDRAFGAALERADALLTTGGVSMGEYDLVAGAFARLGVEEVFHKVAIRPGKPLWFGRRGATLVFGLPGNPVSCLLDHEVFVRPALARMEGCEEETAARTRRGRWEGAPLAAQPRQQNVPVRVEQGEDGVERLVPIPWSGSADIVGLTRASGMAIVPAGEDLASGALALYRPLA